MISIDVKSLSATSERIRAELLPSAFEAKSILVPPEVSVVTSTPFALKRLDLPKPDGKESLLITNLSTFGSNPLIVTSPSVATGTPFINLTEYSKISPAELAVTEPDDKSITGAPESADPSAELITTPEESDTPFKVIYPVLSLSLPSVITVSPSIVEATSTFVEPPDENSEGAPDPLNVIVSLAVSKSEMMTFPSSPLVTAPPENVTSYI